MLNKSITGVEGKLDIGRNCALPPNGVCAQNLIKASFA